MHNPIHPLEGSRPYYPAFCRLIYFVYMSIYIYDNFYRPTLWMSVTFTDLYRLLSVVTCFLISACEAVCVCECEKLGAVLLTHCGSGAS